MQERTIFILVAMMAVVLITSAFGAYRDGDDDSDSDIKKSSKGRKIHHDKPSSSSNQQVVSDDGDGVIGASGAGTSHKTAKAYLDTSGRANGPYVDDGENAYKGKARGHDLHNDSDSDSDSSSDSDSGSDSGSDSDSKIENTGKNGSNGGGNNQDDFKRKLKYIKKSVSNLFKDIFSKWGNQGSVMAPSGIEEMNPDAIPSNATVDGFRVREKMKKRAIQGMSKIKNAFRGRRAKS
jgi:hypothetical protein